MLGVVSQLTQALGHIKPGTKPGWPILEPCICRSLSALADTESGEGVDAVQFMMKLLCSPQENGPTAEEVAKVTKVEQRKWETVLQENIFWHELLVNILQHREYFKVASCLFLSPSMHEPKQIWYCCVAASVQAPGDVPVHVASSRLLPGLAHQKRMLRERCWGKQDRSAEADRSMPNTARFQFSMSLLL